MHSKPVVVSRTVGVCCLALLPWAGLQAEMTPMTFSAWGEPGLLQTPSARFAEAGEVSLTASYTEPYRRLSVMLQPFDWFQAGFRYVIIEDRDFGPAISTRSLQDKSFDARLRLLTESAWRPELALGFRDLGGTGLFSGEYLVGSKRFGDVDLSLGLGWGYLGNRGDVRNPLRLIGDKFNERPGGTGGATGGDFNGQNYFRGPTAVFGGVAWRVPGLPLVLKAEYEGNDYQNDPSGQPIEQDSPVNLGLAWRLSPAVELNAGFERGNTAQFGITLHTNLARAVSQPKLLEPAPAPLSLTPAGGYTSETLAQALRDEAGLPVLSVHQDGSTVTVVSEAADDLLPARTLDRAARVLHNRTGSEVGWFNMVVHSRGLPMISYDIHRQHYLRAQTQPDLAADIRHSPNDVVFASPPPLRLGQRSTPADGDFHAVTPQRLTGGLGLGYQQNIGGPDSFILYQLSADLGAEFRFTPGLWLAGNLSYRLLDNYDRFEFDGPSKLPRVRTNIREYLTTSDLTLPNLQVTGVTQVDQDLFAMAYAGYLESMFAGAGGELLYRPTGSRLALGLDVNRVQQRGFRQDFDLQDYRVTTGHATLYAKTGFEGVLAKISYGRYLAGDVGTTIDLSREFRNGVRIGAYASFTDVSAEEFGEGGFDKGIYVLLPFDLMLPIRSARVANLTFSPLLRDGGAKLNRRYSLYDLTQARDTDLLFGHLQWLKP